MVRTLYAFLLVFLLPGKSAHCQSKASFLIYEKDTINRVDENGTKTGPWVYFWRDTLHQITNHIIYDCYKMNNGKSHCVRTTKSDTVLHFVDIKIASGNYWQGCKEGIWLFGTDSIKAYHAAVIFSADSISKLTPVFAYDVDNHPFCSILYDKGGWQFCHRDTETGIWNDWNHWPDVSDFLAEFFYFDKVNYPAKFTVK